MRVKKIYNVTILGGSDGFGKWLAGYILKHFSEHVRLTITGRSAEKLRATQESLGGELIISSDNIASVEEADVVIFSLPIAQTEQSITQILPYVKSGAVVSDVTSIKGFPKKALSSRDDLIVIPTHPMFGPYLSTIAGQVFVLTADTGVQESIAYRFLTQHLTTQRAKVIECDADYHDKMMAVVQGLTHLNMFVVGETMKRLGFSISDSMHFVSPIYKLMVSSVGRYLGQNPGLYADIQMYNPQVLEVHEQFMQTAKNFHDSVSRRDVDKFCGDIMDAREALGVENCQEGQEYTDKVIYLLGKELDRFKMLIGQEISLKHIYTGEVISGILESFTRRDITLTNGDVYKQNHYELL